MNESAMRRAAGAGLSMLALASSVGASIAPAGAAETADAPGNKSLPPRAALARDSLHIPATEGPEIWSGRVVDAFGKGAADVTVNVWVSHVGEREPIRLGRGYTDRAGAFLVRGAPQEDHLSLAGNDGLIDLILIAERGGETIDPQIMTVRWNASETRWESASPDAEQKTGRPEAPGRSELALDNRPTGDEATFLAAATDSGCYSETVPDAAKRVADHKQYVGKTHIWKDAPLWKDTIEYTKTTSTSTQTGIAPTIGVGPLSFSVNGSVTRSVDKGTRVWTDTQGQSSTATNRKHYIYVSMYTREYRCWQSAYSPPPATPTMWPVRKVGVEPGYWQHTFNRDNFDGNNAACPNANNSFYATGFERYSGSTMKNDVGVTVGVTSGGKTGTFEGKVNVKVAKSTTSKVLQRWSHTGTNAKPLCGVSSQSIASGTYSGDIVAKP